jgi:hypothetical protein
MCLARLLLPLLLVGPLAASAAEPPDAFGRLKTLVGDWEARTPKGSTVRVCYRLVSNDSVLVQSFFTSSGKETLTVFHRDGKRLLATHYCAQGNQPRLKLEDPPKDPASPALVFSFLDATDLATASAVHLTRLELRLTGAGRYTEIETYSENGKEEATTLEFERAQKPARAP